jgi:dual specificity phosphatase 12
MEFLEQGETSGKIICPNEKCKAKVGNYDWAGVSCSCGEWVTPVSSFYIARSISDRRY